MSHYNEQEGNRMEVHNVSALKRLTPPDRSPLNAHLGRAGPLAMLRCSELLDLSCQSLPSSIASQTYCLKSIASVESHYTFSPSMANRLCCIDHVSAIYT